MDRIVGSKVEQGQLDDAPLTLGEISRIKQEFTKVLAGTYHHRIDYPHLQLPPDAPAAATPQAVTQEVSAAPAAETQPAPAPATDPPAGAAVQEGAVVEETEPAPAGSGNGVRR